QKQGCPFFAAGSPPQGSGRKQREFPAAVQAESGEDLPRWSLPHNRTTRKKRNRVPSQGILSGKNIRIAWHYRATGLSLHPRNTSCWVSPEDLHRLDTESG